MGTPSFGTGWEGRVVEGKFPLLEWRGGSDGRGSFFTVLGGMQQAVIQLILASDLDAESHLAQWNFAKDLSHPHISKVLAADRCIIDDRELVYVVTESFDASLSKIIRSGMLDAAGAREIFTPVLSALSYLHKSEVVHGHMNPSTIQFACSMPKLSVTDLLIAGSVERTIDHPGLYDAPEVQNGAVSAASDVWSLGMTLYEAMTDARLSLDSAQNGKAHIVQTLPGPFHEIVQDCLQLDPVRRCSIETILQQLDKTDEILPSDNQVRIEDAGEATTPAHAGKIVFSDEPDEHPAETAPEEPVLFSRYFERFEEVHLKRFRAMPYALVLLTVVAVIGLLLVRRHHATPPSTAASQIAANAQGPAPKSRPNPLAPLVHQPAPEIASPATDVPQKAPPGLSPAALPVDQTLRKPPPFPSHKLSKVETNGTVTKRVLPNVSPGAFEGNPVLVEAQVLVSVNNDGAVSHVEYITPGPGNYFARLAERAAWSWQFTPPMQNGKPSRSVWVLRFYFARHQTEATAERDQRL